VPSNSVIGSIPSVKLIRLSLNHKIKPFDCCVNDLNAFLFNDSKAHLQHFLYVTYILETPIKPIAYITLANDRIAISANDNREFKNLLKKKGMWEMLKDNTTFPAVKIGRFAVDKDYQSKGIGTELLELILFTFINNTNKTGCTFFTVEALNNKRTNKFYNKNKFQFLLDRDFNKESRQMYRCLLAMHPLPAFN